MASPRDWPKSTSAVYLPGRSLIIAGGSVCLLFGLLGLFIDANAPEVKGPAWVLPLICTLVAIVGTCCFFYALLRSYVHVHMCHAESDLLPELPAEPLVHEGAIVYGSLTHELVEDSDGWHFRPSPKLQRNNKRFAIGFGIPFLIGFAAILSWVFHHQMKLGSSLASAAIAIPITIFCGGTPLLLITVLLRAGYQRLCTLRIPRDGADLELEVPVILEPDQVESAAMELTFAPEIRQVPIAREAVVAIQLCPWKFHCGDSMTWANQGLLVLSNESGQGFRREPLLLTNDFIGAARLMEKLAQVLDVPYLFHGDAKGWKAELQRAKHRPPLRAGGTQS